MAQAVYRCYLRWGGANTISSKPVNLPPLVLSMLARAADGPEVENSPQRKVQRTEHCPPNAVDDFSIHEDNKSAGISEPANDHDLRYAHLLEAITESALTTREEISRASLVTSAASDQIENQVGKLTADFEKLQVAFAQGTKSCNERIKSQDR